MDDEVADRLATFVTSSTEAGLGAAGGPRMSPGTHIQLTEQQHERASKSVDAAISDTTSKPYVDVYAAYLNRLHKAYDTESLI